MNTSPTRKVIIAIVKRVLPKASDEKQEAIYTALQGWSKVRGTTLPVVAQAGTAAVKRAVADGTWSGQTNDIVHVHTYATAKTPRNSFTMDIGKVCKVIRQTHPTCWAAVDWDAGTVTPYHGRN